MTEESIVTKVEELMTLLDQVKRYRKMVSYMPNLLVAVLATISISLLVLICLKISFILYGYGLNTSITLQGLLFVFLFLPALIVLLIMLKK